MGGVGEGKEVGEGVEKRVCWRRSRRKSVGVGVGQSECVGGGMFLVVEEE